MGSKLTVPEVIERFRAYHQRYLAWGSLHVVLEDLNVQDCHVSGCIQYAIEQADPEGEALGRILLQMSRTQRLKIANRA